MKKEVKYSSWQVLETLYEQVTVFISFFQKTRKKKIGEFKEKKICKAMT